MPILHVKALPQRYPERVDQAMGDAAAAIAAAYGCRPEQVWVTWEELSPGRYREGKNAASEQPEATHPPIVEILCFEGKAPAVKEAVLTAAAGALTKALGIPGNVFMTYREVRSGEVIAGDGVIRR